MNRFLSYRVIACLFMILFLMGGAVQTLHAQGTLQNAVLFGTVSDSSGAAVAGATVELTSPALQGSKTATTDGSGNYRIPDLPVGLYRITTTMAGFETDVCVTHSAPFVRSSHVSGLRPVSTSTIVMHPSTGQTSEHKLHPTHSVSSTRGIRSSGVGYGPCAKAAARSLRVTGVSAIDARPSASSSAGVRCRSTCPSTGPLTRSR